MKLLILTALFYSFSSFAFVPVVEINIDEWSNGQCTYEIRGEGDIYSSFEGDCKIKMNVEVFKDGRNSIVEILDAKITNDDFFENSNNVYISDKALNTHIAALLVEIGPNGELITDISPEARGVTQEDLEGADPQVDVDTDDTKGDKVESENIQIDKNGNQRSSISGASDDFDFDDEPLR